MMREKNQRKGFMVGAGCILLSGCVSMMEPVMTMTCKQRYDPSLGSEEHWMDLCMAASKRGAIEGMQRGLESGVERSVTRGVDTAIHGRPDHTGSATYRGRTTTCDIRTGENTSTARCY